MYLQGSSGLQQQPGAIAFLSPELQEEVAFAGIQPVCNFFLAFSTWQHHFMHLLEMEA